MNVYGEESNAVVIDIGESTTKAGFAGDDLPRIVFPSVLSERKTPRVNHNSRHDQVDQYDMYAERDRIKQTNLVMHDFGHNVVAFRSCDVDVLSPFNEKAELLSERAYMICLHTIAEELNLNPSNQPLLFAQNCATPISFRKEFAQTVFEKNQIPSLYFANNASLSAFSVGKPTALVLECSARMCSIVPVVDGFCLRNSSLFRDDLSGNALSFLFATQFTQQQLIPHYAFQIGKEINSKHPIQPNVSQSYHDYHILDLYNDLKHFSCSIDFSKTSKETNESYCLPDGTLLTIEKSFVENLQNSLFNNANGLHSSIFHSIQRTDVDIRTNLWQNILCVGGGTKMKNFEHLLTKDLSSNYPQNFRGKVLFPSVSEERLFSVFIGGSILASLGSFQQMWISRKEFQEKGDEVIATRCN